MNDTRSVHIVVDGRVQGVGFRAFVAREAGMRAIGGFTRNLRNGTVEIVAQGDPDAIAALCEACGRGPIGAHVARVDIKDAVEKTHFVAFEIRRDD